MAESNADLSAVKPVVGVVQMTCTPDKEANRSMGTSLVERAHKKGAQVRICNIL